MENEQEISLRMILSGTKIHNLSSLGEDNTIRFIYILQDQKTTLKLQTLYLLSLIN